MVACFAVAEAGSTSRRSGYSHATPPHGVDRGDN